MIKMNDYVEASEVQIGTTCLICGEFIPVPSYKANYPKICDECRARLKIMLYSVGEKNDG